MSFLFRRSFRKNEEEGGGNGRGKEEGKTPTAATDGSEDTFTGNYCMENELGKGAHSTVYGGKNLKTGEKVAIKVLEKSKLSKKDIESIRTEITILKTLTHPNLLVFHEFCEDAKCYYIVTELLEGGELLDRIIERSYYTENDAQAVLRSLASALQYIHSRNIVHRDLKPENILLASTDDDAVIKLADFGFAKMREGGKQLVTALGTPFYIAPEILRQEPYDASVDLWSFGVIMVRA